MDIVNFLSQVAVTILCGYECIVSGGDPTSPLTLFEQCILGRQGGGMLRIQLGGGEGLNQELWCAFNHLQEPPYVHLTTLDQCHIVDKSSGKQPINFVNGTLYTHSPYSDPLLPSNCLSSSSDIILAVLRNLLNFGFLIFVTFYLCQRDQLTIKLIRELKDSQTLPKKNDGQSNLNDDKRGSFWRSKESLLDPKVRLHHPSSYIIPQRRRFNYVQLSNWRNEQSHTIGSSWRKNHGSSLSLSSIGSVDKTPENPPSPIFRGTCQQNLDLCVDDNSRQSFSDDDGVDCTPLENSDELTESQDMRLSQSSNTSVEIESEDEGFEVVKRKRRNSQGPKKVLPKKGLPKIYIYTRRAESHFLQNPGTSLKRKKDLKDYIKYWKQTEQSDWNLPKNFTKTIFPYELKKILQQKVYELTRDPEKFQELVINPPPIESEERQEIMTYLTRLDSPSCERVVIDLGVSEAVQLTKRFGTKRKIEATYVPSTPVQFLPYRWRLKDQNLVDHDGKNEFRFSLHFDTGFIIHLPLSGNYQHGQKINNEGMEMFTFNDRRSSDDEDSTDENDDKVNEDDEWTGKNDRTRLIKRFKPYLLVDFINLTPVKKSK